MKVIYTLAALTLISFVYACKVNADNRDHNTYEIEWCNDGYLDHVILKGTEKCQGVEQ